MRAARELAWISMLSFMPFFSSGQKCFFTRRDGVKRVGIPATREPNKNRLFVYKIFKMAAKLQIFHSSFYFCMVYHIEHITQKLAL